MPTVPSSQDQYSYSQFSNPYTSSKVYAVNICQHVADHKGVASVVYHHST